MSANFPSSVCIVDDDADLVAFLQRYLETRGCETTGFTSAETFLQTASAMHAPFYLIDLSLPGLDGIDLIGMLRAQSNAGIIVISGRMGPDAFMSALAAGADMFINKPVRFDQIYQAILSVTRRISETRAISKIWQYDGSNGLLTAPSGSSVRLTKTERKLFITLLQANGAAVDRPSLTLAAEIAASKDHRNLDAAMFRMRRRIEQQTQLAAPLRTVHGCGYAAAPVDFVSTGV